MVDGNHILRISSYCECKSHAIRYAYQHNHGGLELNADSYGGLPSFQNDSTPLALLPAVPQQSGILIPTEVLESSQILVQNQSYQWRVGLRKC